MARDEDLSVVLRVDDTEVDKLDEAATKVDELEGKDVTVNVEATGATEAAAELGKVGDAGEDAITRARARFPDLFADIDQLKQEAAGAATSLEQSGDQAAAGVEKAGSTADGTGTKFRGMSDQAVDGLARITSAAGPAGEAVGGIAQNANDVASAFGGGGAAAAGLGAVVGVAMWGMQQAAKRTKAAIEDIGKAMDDLSTVADSMVLDTFNRMVIDSIKGGQDLTKTFEDFVNKSPEAARRTLEMMSANDAYADSARMLKGALEQYDTEQAQAKKTQQEFGDQTIDTTGITDDFASKIGEANDALEEQRKKEEEVAAAAGKVDDAFRGTKERVDALGRGFDEFNHTSALDFSEMASNTVQSFDDLKDSMQDVKDLGSKPLVPTTVESLRGLSDESAKVIQNIGNMRDSIQTELGAALESAGGNFDGLRDKAAFFRDEITKQFTDSFTQMGLGPDEVKAKVNELLTALGLMPDQVETQIKITQEQEAMRKIELFGSALDSLPDEVKAQVATALDENDPIRAWNTINTAIQNQGKVGIKTTVNPPTDVSAAVAHAQALANQNPVKIPSVVTPAQNTANRASGGGAQATRTTINNTFLGVRMSRRDATKLQREALRRHGRRYGMAG